MLTNTNNTRSSGAGLTAVFCSLCRIAAKLVPFPIPQTVFGRRRLTVAYVLAVLLVPVLSWATGSVVPMLVLAPVLAMLLFALGLSTDLITDRPTASLDERERHIRDSTLSRPLEVGIVLGVAVGVLATWALGSDEPLPVAALMASTMLAFSVRLMAIAWNLPNSIGEE